MDLTMCILGEGQERFRRNGAIAEIPQLALYEKWELDDSTLRAFLAQEVPK